MKQSEIRFKINLDEQNLPSDIKWQATDTQNQELRDAKSIMISIWDAVQKDTLKIDLWTKEMTIDEMHSHFFQTLLSLAESYQRATQNPYVKEDVKAFAQALAKKTADWESQKAG